jgi:hypothetical protein
LSSTAGDERIRASDMPERNHVSRFVRKGGGRYAAPDDAFLLEYLDPSCARRLCSRADVADRGGTHFNIS